MSVGERRSTVSVPAWLPERVELFSLPVALKVAPESPRSSPRSVLPRSARLTSPSDFATATKSGFRLSSPSLVTYLFLTKKEQPAQCGLIISKNAGGSVVRHKIARQLRHSLALQLPTLPNGALVVVRALPSSALKSGREIRNELAQVLPRLLNKVKLPT